jgi:hypothetical protein
MPFPTEESARYVPMLPTYFVSRRKRENRPHASSGLVFYFDASMQSTINEFRSSILYTPEEIEAVAIQTVDAAEETEVTEAMIPELEYQLEKQENVAGYIVETYREYEIYSDEYGNIIKKVPTSHLDFIRYKK